MQTWRLLLTALLTTALLTGCMGKPNGAKDADAANVPPPEAAYQEPRPTAQPPTPAQTPASSSAPSSPPPPKPAPEPSPEPVAPPPAVAPEPLRELHFQSSDVFGPVAIKLVLTLSGSYYCRAETVFSVADRAEPNSRHILWLNKNGARLRMSDASFADGQPAHASAAMGIDTTPVWGGSAADAAPDTRTQGFSTVIQPPKDAGPGPHEWTYLVAARDVQSQGVPGVRIDIECTRPFNVTGVQAGHQVWLEDQSTLESDLSVSTGDHGAILAGELHTMGDYPIEFTIMTNRSQAQVTLTTAYGNRTWTSSATTANGLDYLDMQAPAGTFDLAIDSKPGTFSVLVASLDSVSSVDALDEAVRSR